MIRGVANYHYSFAGNQTDGLSTSQLDTGPPCAKQMVEDGVNVVLLTRVRPLCLRTVCTLAHVFEAAVLSTVLISSIRDIAERMHPSRALYAEFPLGLFPGKPQTLPFNTVYSKRPWRYQSS